jgi:hypothetical protein
VPWIVENGRRITEGGLSPVFTRHDLHAGKEVQIVREQGRKLTRAVIERVHECWTDYLMIDQDDPHGIKLTQTRGYYHGLRDYKATQIMWKLTDDATQVTEKCDSGSKDYERTCVHVRYRNGVRAVVDCLAYVRPLDSAIEQLAKVLDEDNE